MEILSEAASKELAQGILELAESMAKDMLAKQQKQWLMKKEVCKEYDCCDLDIRRWEAAGLKSRRQGKKRMYKRSDIEEILDLIKE